MPQKPLIRPETTVDHTAIRELNDAAFGTPGEAKLVDAIRTSAGYVPGLSLVAQVDGKVVGHIMFSWAELAGFKVLALAPMAVSPLHQRQGIGSALVETGLELANGMSAGLVVVLGHPEFYPRFGFQQAWEYDVLSPFEVPKEAFMVRPINGYDPGMKGVVRYPEPFSLV